MQKYHFYFFTLFFTFSVKTDEALNKNINLTRKKTENSRRPSPIAYHLANGYVGGSNQSATSTIQVPQGGTGVTSLTPYAVMTGGISPTSPVQQVSGLGVVGDVLTSNGPSTLPTWQNASVVIGGVQSITGDSGGPLTGSNINFTGGTTGLLFSGSGTTETLTGTLAVGHGGTGASTFTAHGVLIGEGTSPVVATSAGTNGQVLLGSTGADPAFITPTAGSGLTLTSNATTLNYALTVPVTVSLGGTGLTSLTPYSVLTGGTGSSLQQVSGVGTTGQVLTSNGAGNLPTWENTSLTGAIQTITGNTGGPLSGSNITFTGGSTGLSFIGSGTTETLQFAGITANDGDVNLATDATNSMINIGIGAGIKTTTLGSTNTTSSTTIQSGSGALNLTSASGNIGISTTNGTITANSGTGTVGISTDATANSLNLGTGAGVKTTTLGSISSTSATTVQSGTGALNITSTNGPLTINSGTGTLSISSDAAATTVNIGTGAGAKTITLGSTDTTSTTTLQAGSGGVKLGTVAEGALVTSSTSVISTVTGTAGGGQALISGATGVSPSFGTLGVVGGGTGLTSLTPYTIVAGGTSSTNPLQQISGTGTTGQVLTSNGPAALPSWQNTSLTGAIQTITGDTGGALSGSNINFSGGSTGLSFNGAGTTETLQFTGITANGGTVSLATDATTSALNIGTGAGAKTTTLGSTNTTSATTIQSGSGALNLTSASGNISISTTNGTITANSGTGIVGISTDATANSLNLGTGAGVKTTTLGSTTSTSATTVRSGTGALNVTSTNGTLTINSGTGALSISNDAAATTVNIGTGAGAKTVTLGSTNTTSTTTLQAGSGGIKLGSSAAGAVVTNSSSVLSSVNGTAGQAFIAGGAGVSPSFGTLGVVGGGTGLSTLATYAILTGGTTTTGAMQQVSGTGTSGQLLTSTGAAALPTWQTSTYLPGYVVSAGNFLFAGRTTTLTGPPSYSSFISSTAASYPNITGGALYNTALGYNALNAITTGTGNTAVGSSALELLQTGISNTSIGSSSLSQLVSGSQNVAAGYQALLLATGSNNTAVGALAGSTLTSGDNNIYIGYNAAPISTTESNNIVIGNSSMVTAYMFGIYGATSTSGTAVYINSSGKLGTTTSSRKFKENIESVDSKTATKILDLDIVQFNYKDDKTKELNYGVIAEDVVSIFPEMIVYDKEGEISTVQYHKLLPLVIKKIQDMQAEIEELKSQINKLNVKVSVNVNTPVSGKIPLVINK